MPVLLRGVARTAVVAGTATHVSNNVSRRQEARYANQDAQQQQQQAAPVQQQPQADVYVEIQKLGQLKSDGILSQEEFDAKKRQLLGI